MRVVVVVVVDARVVVVGVVEGRTEEVVVGTTTEVVGMTTGVVGRTTGVVEEELDGTGDAIPQVPDRGLHPSPQ